MGIRLTNPLGIELYRVPIHDLDSIPVLTTRYLQVKTVQTHDVEESAAGK
jgi:hypothetical protein